MYFYELSHPEIEDKVYIISLFRDNDAVFEDLKLRYADDLWSFDFDYTDYHILFHTQNLKVLPPIEFKNIPKKYMHIKPYFDRHFNLEECDYTIKQVIEDIF